MPASTVRGRVRPSRPQPIGPPTGAAWGKGDPIRRARWSSARTGTLEGHHPIGRVAVFSRRGPGKPPGRGGFPYAAVRGIRPCAFAGEGALHVAGPRTRQAENPSEEGTLSLKDVPGGLGFRYAGSSGPARGREKGLARRPQWSMWRACPSVQGHLRRHAASGGVRTASGRLLRPVDVFCPRAISSWIIVKR